jgi:hypothetical protein
MLQQVINVAVIAGCGWVQFVQLAHAPRMSHEVPLTNWSATVRRE